MVWWQTLIVAIVSITATKLIEELVASWRQNREFSKYRREKAHAEIEDLKNEVGVIYELTANWASYESKQPEYSKLFANSYQLVGKYNKHPVIAIKARDTVHFCQVVAFNERENRADLVADKKQLKEKFDEFIRVCNLYVEQLA